MFGFFPETFFKENWSVMPVAGVNYLGHSQAIGIIFIAVNSTCRYWFRRFKAEDFDVNDPQRPGTPRTAKTDALKSLLDGNPSQT
uniref:Inner membrane protein n=1 Tax=Heterorhabditis bacteriophora TaxID=37862 RepID=A0A1I7XSK5_HETBA